MPNKLLVAPTKNSIQKTLAAQLLSTASTGDAITFADVDGIPNLPGVLVINRIDANGTATPSQREYIEYSGTSGNTVLITTRNVDNSSSAMTHAVGSIVEWIPDVTWADRIYDALSNVVSVADLSVDTAKVVTPTGTQTLTNKTLTTPNLSLGVISSSGATISMIKDEDTMASNSATALATQQSIKAYVDANGVDVTTKGDLQTYSTTGDRLGVGTGGQVLTADSNETTGLKWISTKLGLASVTANQTSISTEVDLTGLSVTVTVPNNATVKITGHGTMLQASTVGSVAMSIYEGATALNESVEHLTTAALQQSMTVMAVLTPSAGSHTYKLRARVGTGAGAATLSASATNPAFILVEVV